MSIEETIAAYDRIAAAYAQRWQDRSVMEAAMNRFLALVPKGALVLDAGCGPGFDGDLLKAHGLRVVGFDLSRGMLTAGRSIGLRTPMVQADMRQLPFGNGIAGVWCNAALLHLSRRDALVALREFFRALQKRGVLYIALKEGLGEGQRSEAYGSETPRYFTYWQDAQLDAVLRQAGFDIVASWTDAAPKHGWLCRLAHRSLPQT